MICKGAIMRKHALAHRPRRPRLSTRPTIEALETRLAPSVDVINWRGNVPGNNSGANLLETQLTPASVNPNTFGLQFTYPVDGQVYAEPLVKMGVPIAGKGTHDVVFVATENDSVYAFDADSFGGANTNALWHTSFLTSGLPGATSITPVPNGVTQSGDIQPIIGITATPYIAPGLGGTGTLYEVSKTAEVVGGVTHYVQRLHALDITTGSDLVFQGGTPGVLIGDTTFGGTDGGYTNNTPISVPGTGDGSDGTTVRFNALRENERDGLFISGGVLYMTFTSHGDVGPYHGWILGYNPTTLQPLSVYNTTPNGGLAAIWMGGGQTAVDSNGNLLFATGNGTFDAGPGGAFAVGGGGGGLGYAGISGSLAVTFRAFTSSSTGLGENGNFLTPNSLSGTGIDFNGGAQVSPRHTYTVTLSYSDSSHTLTESLKDNNNSATFSTSYSVNLPVVIGGSKAFVGFTGGTGGLDMQQTVQTWTFNNGTTTIDHSGGFASNGDLQANGSAGFSGSSAVLTSNFGQAGSIFDKTALDVTNFSTTFTFQMTAGTNPVADGLTFTIHAQGKDYAMSVEKVGPTPGAGGQLPVLDSFTPHDEAPLSNVDLDQGSGGVLMLPAAAGSAAHTNLVVQTGKTGRVYLLDRDNLGGFTPTDSGAVQILPDGTIGGGGSYDTPAYFSNGTQQLIYYMGAGDVLKSFTVANGQLSTQPFAATGQVFGFPGANPMVSANGAQNGIVWVLDDHLNGTSGHPNSGPAVLHAYDATTLTELYNTSMNGLLDQLGNAVKFTVPTVADGKVYVGTQTGLYVLGLFPAPTSKPTAPINLTATATGPDSVVLNWTNTATNARGIRVLRSTGNASNFAQIAEVSPFATMFTDTTVNPGTKFFYEVVATNALGNSPPSNKANVLTPAGAPTLRVASVGSSQVNLAWTPTAGTTFNALRSTDGVNFTLIATVPASVTTFSDNGLSPNVYSYEVQAFDQFGNTAVSNIVRVTVGEPVVIDHSGGFASNSDLQANGSATFTGGVARLTDGGVGEAGTIFSDQKTDIRSFTTTFTFLMLDPMADGMTFIIQTNSPNAIGFPGGGLAYGSDTPGGPQGIPHSVAIKFDLFDNAGEGIDSTGIFFNGDSPTVPTPSGAAEGEQTIDMTGIINLHSGDVFQATLTLSGNTLTETITDTVTHAMFITSYTVNIASVIGADTAFVGFGGGTGGLTTVADVQTWKFTPTTQNLAPLSPTNLKVASVVAHDATRNDITLTWTTNSFNETGFEVWRSTDGTTFALIATLPPNSMSFTDIKAAAGTYFYKVRAFNANGDSNFTNVDSVITGTPGATVMVDHSGGFASNSDLTANGSATFTPNATPVGIFAGHQDIGTQGDPSPAGGATFDSSSGAYTLTASGSDIWDVSDHMQYVYESITGDGSIVARLVSAGTPDFWTKAGVMIRDSLNAGAADDFMLDTPSPDHQEPVMQFRDSDGSTTSDSDNHFTSTTPNVPTPMWLRLDRVGNVFTGFWAVDNNGTPGPWQLMSQSDPHTTIMPATVFFGLALTAHSNGNVASVTFDHVSVTGTTAPLPPTVAELTDGGFGEAGSVFTNSRVGVTNFNTTFTFRMHVGTSFMADGMAFVIQGSGPSALGGTGGGLGYGSDHPGGPQGIPNSVAIKFDLFDNAGEGTDSTGIFFNGDSPTVPSQPGESSIDLSNTGIDLHSQDVFQVTLNYSGTTLTETITDTVTAATFTTSYTVNIAALVGSTVGYAGFTGGTGGLTTVADVQTWVYNFVQPLPSQPQLAAGGGVTGAVPALTEAELAPVVQEAVALWAASGLSAAQVTELQAVQYQIAALGGGALGLTVLGMPVVTLDATAAGYGWYVDPGFGSVFGNAVTSQDLQAAPGSPAFGRMDLLTVVEHELGHVLGLADINPLAAPHDLLTTTLAPGVRRLPMSSLDPLAVGIITADAASTAAPALEATAAAPVLDPAITAESQVARSATTDETLLLSSPLAAAAVLRVSDSASQYSFTTPAVVAETRAGRPVPDPLTGMVPADQRSRVPMITAGERNESLLAAEGIPAWAFALASPPALQSGSEGHPVLAQAEATAWQRAWDNGLPDSAWLSALPDESAAQPTAPAEDYAGIAASAARPMLALAVVLVGAFRGPTEREEPKKRRLGAMTLT
jgi:hypothetical protein